MMIKLSKRGGARPGAGRKPSGISTTYLRVRQEDHDYIKGLADELGYGQADIVHELVVNFKDNVEESI